MSTPFSRLRRGCMMVNLTGNVCVASTCHTLTLYKTKTFSWYRKKGSTKVIVNEVTTLRRHIESMHEVGLTVLTWKIDFEIVIGHLHQVVQWKWLWIKASEGGSCTEGCSPRSWPSKAAITRPTFGGERARRKDYCILWCTISRCCYSVVNRDPSGIWLSSVYQLLLI